MTDKDNALLMAKKEKNKADMTYSLKAIFKVSTNGMNESAVKTITELKDYAEEVAKIFKINTESWIRNK